MRIAFGPNREIIDIHRRGQYEQWHSKGGLKCVVCGDRVHPYRLNNGNTWLRHNADSETHSHVAALGSGGQSYEHISLTHWLCGWLESRGHEARCDRQVETSRPDVQALVGGRRLAFEVQVSPLPREEARRRTELLAANGYEVLWLTRNLDWVDSLPAVGLHMEEERPRFTTTEVHGRFYSVREGVLSSAPSGRLAPGHKRPALETFLKQFIERRAQWALAGIDSFGEHSGWATMGDWRQHNEWQAKRLRELGNRVHAVDLQLERLKSSLELRERELETALAQLLDEKNRSHDTRQQLQESDSRMRAARGVVEEREAELFRVREELGRSLWGRRLLKRLGLL